MSLRYRLAGLVPERAVRTFASPYVAGDRLEDALSRADELWDHRGIQSTIDVLGEHVETEAGAARALALYERAAAAVSERPHCSLSMKPGHFGHYVDRDLCREHVRRLATVCQAQGTKLTIDMEDVDLTDDTLALYRALRPEFPVLGTVLQSRLHRTAADLAELRGLDARLRLCIGVYDVAPEHGAQSKAEAKRRLLDMLPAALETCQLVELATHDVDVIGEARRIVASIPGADAKMEYQMLLGVPREPIQTELVRSGAAVRLYVPFAESWHEATAYLRRRLAESPGMGVLVLRNLLPGANGRRARS